MTYAPFSLYEYDLVPGDTGTIAFGQADPGGILVLAYSVSGPGPLLTPFGEVGLDLPFFTAGPFVASGEGLFSVNVPLGPSTSGLTLYNQAVTISGGQLLLSNAERVFLP